MTQKWTKWLVCDWWSISCKEEVVHDAFGPSLLIVVNEAASVSVRTSCSFLLCCSKSLQWLQMLWFKKKEKEKKKQLCVAKQKKSQYHYKVVFRHFLCFNLKCSSPRSLGFWDSSTRYLDLIVNTDNIYLASTRSDPNRQWQMCCLVVVPAVTAVI